MNFMSWEYINDSLPQIEELYVYNSSDINDMEATASNLVNLKSIYMRHADIESIMTFTRRSPNIKKVYVFDLLKHKTIDMATLNRERLKLPNAKKITLYFEKSIFLPNRIATPSIYLDLIKLQRLESAERDHDFF